MKGTPTIPFSALVADTIAAHGLTWAAKHYSRRASPFGNS